MFFYSLNFLPYSGLSHGWWRSTDPDEIVSLERSLHMRGAREQILLQNLKKTMDFVHEATKKPLAETLVFEVPESEDEMEMLPGNAPPKDIPGDWSYEVALRVDKYILEQVEALEDKVAAASMQVPVKMICIIIMVVVEVLISSSFSPSLGMETPKSTRH